MKYLACALPVLLLCQLAFPSFSFLYMTNGTMAADSDNYYLFSQPTGLYLVGDRLYVADSGKGMIYVLNAGANLSRAKALFSSSTEAYLSNPMHMEYENSTGILYIAGGTTGNILYYGGEGSGVDKWNAGTTALKKANGIALSNSTIYVADGTLGQLLAFSRTTKAYASTAVRQGASDGTLSSPQDILFHGGKTYVSDAAKGLVFVYDSNFTLLDVIGRGKGGVDLKSPRGMDFDDNRLYVADAGMASVVAFSLDGYPVDMLNSSTAWGNLSYPEDVIVDRGILYVADTQNRLVKVFAINKSGGDPSVLAMIAQANATCASLASMQSVASKLGIPCPQVQYSGDLSSAQSYYDSYAFSYSASLAQQANATCASAQSALVQSVNLKIQQLIQDSQAKVAPYRDAPATNRSKLAQFDNKAAAASYALSSQSYPAAADAALSLQPLADSIVAGSELAAAAEEEKKESQSLASIAAEIAALGARVDALQAKSDAYRQALNLTGSRELVVIAQRSAQAGDFAAANHSLQLAIVEVTAYETVVSDAAGEIDAALPAIAAAEYELNSTASKTMLLPPDLSREKAQMAQARVTLYSSPQLALQMASQAKASADAKSREAQALSSAAAAVLVMLLLIAALAAAFLLHLSRRKKKGL